MATHVIGLASLPFEGYVVLNKISEKKIMPSCHSW